MIDTNLLSDGREPDTQSTVFLTEQVTEAYGSVKEGMMENFECQIRMRNFFGAIQGIQIFLSAIQGILSYL
jgi:hypothetical protein